MEKQEALLFPLDNWFSHFYQSLRASLWQMLVKGKKRGRARPNKGSREATERG